MRPLILASESVYKKELLSRLGIPFISTSPNTDESVLPDESATAMSLRLSEQKAISVSEQQGKASHTVIGADQTAECLDTLVRKPGTHEQAIDDLMSYSGKQMTFFTSTAVICPELNYSKSVTETICATFRQLDLHEIENYLAIEKPYDCAGSFKCEGLGISLFESIESSDPFALIGLPLIGISKCLHELGYDLYSNR